VPTTSFVSVLEIITTNWTHVQKARIGFDQPCVEFQLDPVGPTQEAAKPRLPRASPPALTRATKQAKQV
jgi:hypothetical protein